MLLPTLFSSHFHNEKSSFPSMMKQRILQPSIISTSDGATPFQAALNIDTKAADMISNDTTALCRVAPDCRAFSPRATRHQPIFLLRRHDPIVREAGRSRKIPI